MAYRRVNMAAGANRLTAIGDDGSAAANSSKPSLGAVLSSPTVKTAAGVTLLWHGYKRTGSVVAALLYGLAGRTLPAVAVPIAVAQGLGQRKACP